MNDALDSRPDALGACDERLDTPLPAQVKLDFATVANVLGYGSSAALNRKLIEDFLYGNLHSIRMAVSMNRVDGRKRG